MKTLQSRYIRKNLEQTLISERLLVEAINTELLDAFRVALQKGDELAEILSNVDFTIFTKIIKQLTTIVKNEFKKSTDFFGNDKLIRSKIKSWLQKHWKNSTLQMFDSFIDDLDDSFKRATQATIAFIPKSQKNSIDQINDLFLHEEDGGKRSLQQLKSIIKNSFQFSEPRDREVEAIDEASARILYFSVDQLTTLSEMISEVRKSVSNSVDKVESDSQQNVPTETQSEPKETNVGDEKLNITTIVDALSSLSKQDFATLMRYINAKRKMSNINL